MTASSVEDDRRAVRPKAAPSYPGRVAARARRFTGAVPWLVFAFVLFMLLVWPLIMLVVGSLRTAPPGVAGDWGLAGYERAYTSALNYRALGHSAILAVTTTAGGLVAALLLLLVSVKTSLWVGRLVTPAMLALLALPPMFYGISYSMLGNPGAGLLSTVFHGAGGGTITASWWGVIVVSAFKATAWAYVLLLGPFKAFNAALEEAAQLAGAGRHMVFLRIVVPLLRPALVGVAVLLLVVGLEAFDVPLILGLPAGIRVFSTQIYNLIGNSNPPDYAAASALSLLLVVVVAVLALAARRILAGRSYATTETKMRRGTPWRLGAGRIPLLVFTLLFLLVAVVLPLAQMVVGSLEPYFGVYGAPTLANYQRILDDPGLSAAVRTTVLVSLVGGAASMLVATLVSYVQSRWHTRSARLLNIVAWLPLGLPGLVLGLGLLWGYTSLPVLSDLYGTPWLMLLGLVVVGLPVGARASDGAIAQISEDLESAGRIAGASRLVVVRRILARLLMPSLLAGWFTVAIVLSGNLDVPILLSSTTAQPASVMAYNLYLDGDNAAAAALLCLVIGGGAVALTVGAIVGRLVTGGLLVTALRRRVRRPGLAVPAPDALAARPAPDPLEAELTEKERVG